MLDSALKIMIFMWAVSFSVLGGQYVVGDVIGIELTNFNGDPVKSNLLTIIDVNQINTQTELIITANFTGNTTFYDRVETFTTGAAFAAWELITLLSGTYIFNFMYLMGIPIMFVTFFVIIYFVLLARAVMGYVRGV